MTDTITALQGLTLAEYASGGVGDSFTGCDDLRDRVGLDTAELRRALREYWLEQMPEAQMLGLMFAYVLHDELMGRDPNGELLTLVQSGDMHPGDCLDDNMVMVAAWNSAGCSDIDFNCEGGDGMTQEQADLWNAAYPIGLDNLRNC